VGLKAIRLGAKTADIQRPTEEVRCRIRAHRGRQPAGMFKHPGGAPAKQNLWDRQDEVPMLPGETGCARVALQPFHRFGTIADTAFRF